MPTKFFVFLLSFWVSTTHARFFDRDEFFFSQCSCNFGEILPNSAFSDDEPNFATGEFSAVGEGDFICLPDNDIFPISEGPGVAVENGTVISGVTLTEGFFDRTFGIFWKASRNPDPAQTLVAGEQRVVLNVGDIFIITESLNETSGNMIVTFEAFGEVFEIGDNDLTFPVEFYAIFMRDDDEHNRFLSFCASDFIDRFCFDIVNATGLEPLITSSATVELMRTNRDKLNVTEDGLSFRRVERVLFSRIQFVFALPDFTLSSVSRRIINNFAFLLNRGTNLVVLDAKQRDIPQLNIVAGNEEFGVSAILEGVGSNDVRIVNIDPDLGITTTVSSTINVFPPDDFVGDVEFQVEAAGDGNCTLLYPFVFEMHIDMIPDRAFFARNEIELKVFPNEIQEIVIKLFDQDFKLGFPTTENIFFDLDGPGVGELRNKENEPTDGETAELGELIVFYVPDGEFRDEDRDVLHLIPFTMREGRRDIDGLIKIRNGLFMPPVPTENPTILVVELQDNPAVVSSRNAGIAFAVMFGILICVVYLFLDGQRKHAEQSILDLEEDEKKDITGVAELEESEEKKSFFRTHFLKAAIILLVITYVIAVSTLLFSFLGPEQVEVVINGDDADNLEGEELRENEFNKFRRIYFDKDMLQVLNTLFPDDFADASVCHDEQLHTISGSVPCDRCIQGLQDSCTRNRLINNNDCENLICNDDNSQIVASSKAVLNQLENLDDLLFGEQGSCNGGCLGKDHLISCESAFPIVGLVTELDDGTECQCDNRGDLICPLSEDI